MFVGNAEEDFELLCYENNINVTIVSNIGSRVRGLCYYDGEYYNVLLNNRFDEFQIKRTVIHEVIHILEDHFNQQVSSGYRCEQHVHMIMNNLKIAIA